jgi:hypothetical protein
VGQAVSFKSLLVQIGTPIRTMHVSEKRRKEGKNQKIQKGYTRGIC